MKKRFGMMPILLASVAMPRREGEEPGAEGAPALGVGTPAPAPQEPVQQQEAPAGDRPAAWPEGVNSWEDFGKLSPEEQAKAYAPKEEPVQLEPLTEEQQGILTASLEGVSAEMAPKVTPFVEKFIRNGTLTDTEVTEAAKATGFSEAMVRQYMANGEPATIQAQADATTAPVFELVGGQENYAGFQAWANEALGPNEHAEINAALGIGKDGKASGDINAEALKPFTEMYMASGRGPAPRDVTANAANVSDQAADTDVFASQEEQNRAINDPRYKRDSAYRAKVEAKIGRSNF